MSDLLPALLASCPPVEETALGGWWLRRGAGGGRRASAATWEGTGLPGPEDVAAAAAAMRDWDERPVFMVREGEAALDARLADLGYEAEGASVLYAAPASALAFRSTDLTVIDCDGAIGAIRDLWASSGMKPGRLAGMERVQGPRRFLLGRLDDRPAGAAFVSAAEGTAILNALVVNEPARRQGLGGRITRWSAAWAEEIGADRLALAVDAGNAQARAFYAQLGMAPAGGYRYRTMPR